MAQNLQLLKRRIKTAQNIAQVARAMEMISASKIKRAQAAVENNKPYAARITNLTRTILTHADLEEFNHPYIDRIDSPTTILLAISTDKGLCGSLNTNLFKKLIELDNKNLKIITLGKKVEKFSRKLEGEVIANYNIGTTLPDYSIVFKIIETINNLYSKDKPSRFQILFSQFNSIFSQESITKDILPIQAHHEEEPLPYIFEPQAQEILSELLPYYLEVVLYSTIIEAFTSEQGARMIAMQNAKNNAFDIADYLTLSYNKSRQERITNELLSLANNI